jgi:hypothetical protein
MSSATKLFNQRSAPGQWIGGEIFLILWHPMLTRRMYHRGSIYILMFVFKRIDLLPNIKARVGKLGKPDRMS